MSARLPSPESATLEPNSPSPISSAPAVSFEPCFTQAAPDSAKAQAAPRRLPSARAPMRAVLPSAESATPRPKWPSGVSSLPPASVVCKIHFDSVRLNTHALPWNGHVGSDTRRHGRASCGLPTIAVLPSADSATLLPKLQG